VEPYDGSDPTKCNMPRKGKFCRNGAGKGTDHLGFGYCAKHGGQKGPARKHGMRLMAADAVATYGLPRQVDPHTALLEEVWRTAGHVEWLNRKVREIEEDGLVWGVTREETGPHACNEPGPLPKQESVKGGEALPYKDDARRVLAADANIWLKLYQAERKHLTDVCRTAIACGIAERQVKVAEEFGRQIAERIRLVLVDVGVDPTEERVRLALRRRLELPPGSEDERGDEP